MPMKTMFVTRGASWPPSRRSPPSSPSEMALLAATTWATISAADMLRVRPAWPVAQNGQFMPHPAWDDTQSVTRPG